MNFRDATVTRCSRTQEMQRIPERRLILLPLKTTTMEPITPVRDVPAHKRIDDRPPKFYGVSEIGTLFSVYEYDRDA